MKFGEQWVILQYYVKKETKSEILQIQMDEKHVNFSW